VQALYKSGQEANFNFEILDAVMNVNENQKTVLFPKMKNFFKGDLTGKKIALWGLAFKPNTDDIREAPAFYVIDALLEAGATVSAFDPEAMSNSKMVLGDKVQFADNQYETLKGADALIIATEWNEFRALDMKKIRELMNTSAIPLFMDFRNIYQAKDMTEFKYHRIGQKA
jgi:UDPglucose 6-dehydrogenase